jgi:Protein of unknown function (DUF4232)
MFKRFRRTAAASVAVLALGAGGPAWAASAASAAATPTAVVPHCTSNNLAVWVYADGAGTVSGTTTYNLEFSNLGRGACSLTGFPAVTATTLHRVELGPAAARLYGVPDKTIVIPAGGTAHSLIGYLGSRVVPGCKPANAGFLQVLAPNAGGTKRAYFPLPVCTTDRVDLTVRRVAAGF